MVGGYIYNANTTDYIYSHQTRNNIVSNSD
jgi:hypothetical protein